jgi:ABC-type xylose transport system, periplasmic component
MIKMVWTVPLICLLALAGPFFLAADELPKPVRVAVALSFVHPGRWDNDLAAMKEQAASLGLELMVEVAGSNQMQQNSQVDKMLSRRPDILILSAQDAAGAASIIKNAHLRGVKVIAYDRLVLNAGADLYITFDNEKIGELQANYLIAKAPEGDYILLSGAPTDNNSRQLMAGAMKVLKPLIDSRQIRVVGEGPVIGWEAAEARDLVDMALNNTAKPAAVLAPNDMTASGAIDALAIRGLAGRVPVSGQDADPAAVRRIMAETQSMTVFKDSSLLVRQALELAAKLAGDESASDLATEQTWDGSHFVPTLKLEPVLVDQSNLEQVLISSGVLRYDQVYGRPNF